MTHHRSSLVQRVGRARRARAAASRIALATGAIVAGAIVVTVSPVGPAMSARAAAVVDAPAAIAVREVDTWAWCGVHPDDPAAPAAARSMATVAGIDATFGPCNVPSPDYTPAFTANRYVTPEMYRRLVDINAAAGMKTVVYDARIWSDDAAVRATAISFWLPVVTHIAAWDMGDEFDPAGPQWTILIDRWNTVLGDATVRTGVRPFANHLPTAVPAALRDLAGSGWLMSFAEYRGDLGAAVARAADAASTRVMCGVNAFEHLDLHPSVASIRAAMPSLVAAGCDQILVFGGARVYGSEAAFGWSSLVEPDGEATPWAVAVREGSGRSGFTPVMPARVLETRSGEGLATVDGVSYALGTRTPGGVTEVQIGGRAGVPMTAAAVTVNVTVTNTAAAGYLTLFPCGAPQPVASTLNHGRGVTLSAASTVRLGEGGRLCVFNAAALDLIIDVIGFSPSGASFAPVQPARLLDSRTDQPTGTVDGISSGIGVRQASTVTELPVVARAGVPSTATAVMLGVTVVDARAPGFVTVFPCDASRPNASQVNFAAGATVANTVLVGLSASGEVCVFTSADTDLVVDVLGYHPAGVSVVAVLPARMLETRTGPGLGTVDGLSNGSGLRAADSVTELQVTGRAGVPSGATSVVLNITVTDPRRAGFVAVYACGTPRPNAASLNMAARQTISNFAVADLDASGRVCIYTMSATHLVVDVVGYHP